MNRLGWVITLFEEKLDARVREEFSTSKKMMRTSNLGKSVEQRVSKHLHFIIHLASVITYMVTT
jgi:hypothetical protein